MHDNCRTSYSDCYDIFKISIASSAGESRYQGMPEDIIPLFWRDLLLTAIMQGDKAVLAKFKAHVAGPEPKADDWGKTASLADLLPITSGSGQKSEEDLQDRWYSDAMRKALPKLVAFLKE